MHGVDNEAAERVAEDGARATFFAAAVALFLSTWLIAGIWNESVAIGVLVGISAVVVQVLLAAPAVRICEALNAWGYPERYAVWPRSRRIQSGAYWPGLLLYWIIVATFGNLLSDFYKGKE